MYIFIILFFALPLTSKTALISDMFIQLLIEVIFLLKSHPLVIRVKEQMFEEISNLINTSLT